MQDAEATALKAKAAKGELVALEAEVLQCSSNLKHLEHLQKKLEGAKGDDVDMTKQLIELRCASPVRPYARCPHRQQDQSSCLTCFLIWWLVVLQQTSHGSQAR